MMSYQTGNNLQRQQHTYTISGSRGRQPLGQAYNVCFRKGASQSNYMDIGKIMDGHVVQQKKGLLSDAEIQKLVKEVAGCARGSGAQSGYNYREVKPMEANLNKYNVAPLREIPTQCNNGAFRILVCQMGSCLGERSQGIEDSTNRKTESQVQTIRVHGAELQLGNSGLIGPP
jgi:hypothetical protein